jgi:HTH-type transcriptional regulator/antitoxin HipB
VTLIRARIARGLTQRQLAERVGLPEQAVQRYEAADYAGVSFARLVEIADALEVTIHYDVRLSQAG